LVTLVVGVKAGDAMQSSSTVRLQGRAVGSEEAQAGCAGERGEIEVRQGGEAAVKPQHGNGALTHAKT
jgi:hypothetical protein